MVHVSNSHTSSSPNSQAHEGKAFEHLAANGTSTHLLAGTVLVHGMDFPKTSPLASLSSPRGSVGSSVSPEDQSQTQRFAHRICSFSMEHR